MTAIARLGIGLLLIIFSSSCAFDINLGEGKKGNGVIAEENREITEEFTVVSASEGIMVYLTQANDFNIRVEADENVIELIATDIEDGRLRIHAEKNIGRATKKVYVSLPDITALKSSSGANILGENVIKSEKLSIDGSSGGVFKGEIAVSKVEVDASSGAYLNISGEVNSAYIDGSSGANIKAAKLVSKTCNAEASSGANVSIHVSQSLTADASSGANISYAGDPDVQKKKSVSGSVHKY